MKSYMTENGMMILAQAQHFCNSVTISLYVRAGILYEDINKRGISHLLEHMLFRSLSGMTQAELYENLRELGTTLYACTYRDCIKFEITVLSKYKKEAFELIASVFKPQCWKQNEISAEKNVVCKQIDYKFGNAFHDTFDKYVLQNDCWYTPIMGNISMVKRISGKALMEWHKQVFQPNSACLAITGDFSELDLNNFIQIIEQYQEASAPFKPLDIVPAKLFHRDKFDIHLLSVKYDITQFSISFDVPPEYRKFAGAFYYLLGLVTSKLSLKLREEEVITDEIEMYIEHYISFSRIVFQFYVDKDELGKGVQCFFTTLRHILNHIDLFDVNSIRQHDLKETENLQIQPSELNDIFAWNLFVRPPKVPFSLKELQDITLSELKNAARQIFCSRNMVVVSEFNSKSIKKDEIMNILSKCKEILY